MSTNKYPMCSSAQDECKKRKIQTEKEVINRK